MSVLSVEAAGPGLTVQDEGRFGWRRYGISTAGAMDRLSLAIANSLVGNPHQSACLELMVSACRLRVEEGTIHLAVAGPGVELAIDSTSVSEGRSAHAAPGQIVSVSAPRDGVYGYLAVAGGFDFPQVMGSRSTHRRSGVGPPPIIVGQKLFLSSSHETRVSGPNRLASLPRYEHDPIRIIPGPQEEWFQDGALKKMTEAEWHIGVRSDRMGLFLDGPDILPLGGSMVSDGVLPGCIQVPPSGTPIVLMRDCQTTGGYPKIATVISADLDRLSQFKPGQTLQFECVTHAQAVAASKALQWKLSKLKVEPAIRTPDAQSLLGNNLIDGLWGGQGDSDDPIA